MSLCETINVCNYLTSNAEYIIENNSEGCNRSEEIIALCGDEFNTITGQILYDINDNGCDVDDIHVKNTLVYTSNDLTSYSTITDDAGGYVLYVEEGSFTTTAFVNDENIMQTIISILAIWNLRSAHLWMETKNVKTEANSLQLLERPFN